VFWFGFYVLGVSVERKKLNAADFFAGEGRKRVIERHPAVIKHFAALPAFRYLWFMQDEKTKQNKSKTRTHAQTHSTARQITGGANEAKNKKNKRTRGQQRAKQTQY
jgi:hypothetical protein